MIIVPDAREVVRVYFEAEILIDPSEVQVLVAPSPTGMRRLLERLWGGWRSALDEQEVQVGAVLLEQLRKALHDLGIDDVVSLGRDGTVIYFDERGEGADLDRALARAEPPPGGFEHLRMVLQHHDEILSYVIDVSVSRLFPPDGFPLRVMVHGLWRELDARSVPLGRGGDLLRNLDDAIAARVVATPSLDGRHAIPEAFERRVAALAEGLREGLPGAAVVRCARVAMVLPAEPRTRLEALPDRSEPGGAAPFMAAPGFGAMRWYAYRWGEACRRHGVTLRNVMFVDEAGRPVFRVGDEPLEAARCECLRPGTALREIPCLDVAVLTEHDREPQVREALLVSESEADGELTPRMRLRAHELRAEAVGLDRHVYNRLFGRNPGTAQRSWGGSIRVIRGAEI